MFKHALDTVERGRYIPLLVHKGPVAQLAEPPAHNRSVPGSNPGWPTILPRCGGLIDIIRHWTTVFRIYSEVSHKGQWPGYRREI